jgi:hypothetical protein
MHPSSSKADATTRPIGESVRITRECAVFQHPEVVAETVIATGTLFSKVSAANLGVAQLRTQTGQ